jgi:predicted alpha/beta superfamily hydrolase
VPEFYTAEDSDLFVSGDFNDWSLKHPKYRLEKVASSVVNPWNYRIQLDLAEGEYKYKLTRGIGQLPYGRSAYEVTSSGDKWQYRQLSVLPKQSSGNVRVTVEIENWADYFGVHTVVGDVHLVRSNLPYPQLNATKEIFVYLPPDYHTSTTKTYSVVYLQDGVFNFDSFWDTEYGELKSDETMESFYRQRKEVSILVGIASTNRTMEYTPFSNYFLKTAGLLDEVGGQADLYMDFVVNNLKPYIDRNYRTRPEREHTALVGASYGAVAALYGGLKYNQVFSKLGMFSTGFLQNYSIYDWVAHNLPRYRDTKMYFTAGSLEVSNDLPIPLNASDDMLRMVKLLESKGFADQIRYTIREEKHTWSFWSKEFPLTYSWLFYDF